MLLAVSLMEVPHSILIYKVWTAWIMILKELIILLIILFPFILILVKLILLNLISSTFSAFKHLVNSSCWILNFFKIIINVLSQFRLQFLGYIYSYKLIPDFPIRYPVLVFLIIKSKLNTFIDNCRRIDLW